MLYWDKKVGSERPVLAKLSQSQRFFVVRACIQDARKIFVRAPENFLCHRGKNFFESAFILIENTSKSSELPRGSSQQLLEDMSWLDDVPSASWDMAMSLSVLLKKSGEPLSVEDVLESMGRAYQVVLYNEILSKLRGNATESEVAQMEEANLNCTRCIERQLRHIAEAFGVSAED